MFSQATLNLKIRQFKRKTIIYYLLCTIITWTLALSVASALSAHFNATPAGLLIATFVMAIGAANSFQWIEGVLPQDKPAKVPRAHRQKIFSYCAKLPVMWGIALSLSSIVTAAVFQNACAGVIFAMIIMFIVITVYRACVYKLLPDERKVYACIGEDEDELDGCAERSPIYGESDHPLSASCYHQRLFP